MVIKWQFFGEAEFAEGTHYRCVDGRRYQFIEILDLADHFDDWKVEPGYHYDVTLKFVDLDEIPMKEFEAAFRSCDTPSDATDERIAFDVQSYGLYALLDSWSGNNGRELIRAAKREANDLLDNEALEEAMNRPVNRIGSTAAEMMRGDVHSAMERGVYEGRQEACIMAKMHGIDQQTIDDVRPSDWLPFFIGYLDGKNGSVENKDPDIAETYVLGYRRGVNVREGKANPPGWIKS